MDRLRVNSQSYDWIRLIYQVESKKHKYWFKKRKEVRIVVDVEEVKLKEGRVSSLVLRYEDRYLGHVSGIDTAPTGMLRQPKLTGFGKG